MVAITVWVFFGVDYAVRIVLARQRVRWFFRHILDFLVLVLPPLRPLRLVRLLVLFRVFRRNAPRLIQHRIVAFASIATVLLVYIASLAVWEAERNVGAINTCGDALWWSLVTVTTVGDGDYTPVSFIGRFIAVGLMLGGVVLVGIIVGTLGSWIIHSVSDDNESAIDETTEAVVALRDEVRQLRAAVEHRGSSSENRSEGRLPVLRVLLEPKALAAIPRGAVISFGGKASLTGENGR